MESCASPAASSEEKPNRLARAKSHVEMSQESPVLKGESASPAHVQLEPSKEMQALAASLQSFHLQSPGHVEPLAEKPLPVDEVKHGETGGQHDEIQPKQVELETQKVELQPDHVEASAVETPAEKPQPDVGVAEAPGDLDPQDGDLEDAPMISREDQQTHKKLREAGELEDVPKTRGRKPRAKATAKPKPSAKNKVSKTAVLKRPAAQRSKGKKVEKAEKVEEEDQAGSEDEILPTQHFSPPSSPIPKRKLQEEFDEADSTIAEDGSAQKEKPAPKRKASAANGAAAKKAKPENKDHEDPGKEKVEKQKESKGAKGGAMKGEETAQDEGVLAKKKSFAGRFPPKRESAKQRFDVMLATYEAKIWPFINVNPSQVEARV